MMDLKKLACLAVAIYFFSVTTAAAFNQPPVVGDIQTSATSIVACENVELSGSGFDPESGVSISLKWTIQLNGNIIYDGRGEESVSSGKLNSKLVLRKRYTENPGNLAITLTGSDGEKSTAKQIIISVSYDNWPVIDRIDISAPAEGHAFYQGDKGSLNVIIGSYAAGKLNIKWTFDHNVFGFSSDTIANPEFTVLNADDTEKYYDVSAEIRNACGKNATAIIRISVMKKPKDELLKAVITMPSNAGEDEGFWISAMDSTAIDGSKPNHDFTCYWWWNKLGNKQKLGETTACSFIGSLSQGGYLYEFHLRVINRDGISSNEVVSSVFIKKTRHDAPVADLSATKIMAVEGQPFELNASKSYSPQGFLGSNWTLKFKWEITSPYGDMYPIFTTKKAIFYTFNWTGTWKIKLIATTTDQRVTVESNPAYMKVSVEEAAVNVQGGSLPVSTPTVRPPAGYGEPEPLTEITEKKLPPFVAPPQKTNATSAFVILCVIMIAYVAYRQKNK